MDSTMASVSSRESSFLVLVRVFMSSLLIMMHAGGGMGYDRSLGVRTIFILPLFCTKFNFCLVKAT